MNVFDLKEIIKNAKDSDDVVIEIQSYGIGGGTPSVMIERVHSGFDWDSGRLIIKPSVPLAVETSEGSIDVDGQKLFSVLFRLHREMKSHEAKEEWNIVSMLNEIRNDIKESIK